MDEQILKNDEELTVGGYRFANRDDALLAAAEMKRIEQLELRMDYAKPQTVYVVYTKAIENKVFCTPIGQDYLKSLQDYLTKFYEGDKADILPIPLFQVFGGTEKKQEVTPIERVKNVSYVKNTGKRKKGTSPVSIIVIIVLVIMVIAMFAINLNGTTPNVLNYERVLQNKYASWEQELREREDAIREKERELMIESEEE